MVRMIVPELGVFIEILWVTGEVRKSVETSPTSVHVATSTEVAEVIAYLASDAAGGTSSMSS